jgi:hypothetical protein
MSPQNIVTVTGLTDVSGSGLSLIGHVDNIRGCKARKTGLGGYKPEIYELISGLTLCGRFRLSAPAHGDAYCIHADGYATRTGQIQLLVSSPCQQIHHSDVSRPTHVPISRACVVKTPHWHPKQSKQSYSNKVSMLSPHGQLL